MDALRLLIIEKSINQIENMKRELQRCLAAGSLIESASQVPELTAKLPLFKPDVIIINVAMTLMLIDEQPLMTWLKDHSQAPRIIYGLTGATRQSALHMGADDFVRRPGLPNDQSPFYDALMRSMTQLCTATNPGHDDTVGPSAVVTRELWRATKPVAPSSSGSQTVSVAALAKESHPIPDSSSSAVAAALKNARATRAMTQMVINQNSGPAAPAASELSDVQPVAGIRLIAIGSSTGGTDALSKVISHLSPPLPGIVIVQHIPPMFSRLLAQRLDSESALTVKEAATGDEVLPDHVYLAPGNKHMTLSVYGTKMLLDCSPGPPVHSCCPSVDVLFDSIAGSTAAKDTLGVILTGMGRDGADSLLKLRQLGATTIGQDEASCVVYGMPKAAFDIGAVEHQLPLGDIPAAIMKITQ